jgi:F0F1-type ATP synthase assembly protein I
VRSLTSKLIAPWGHARFPAASAPENRDGATIWNSPAFGLVGIGSYLATSIVGLTLVGRWLDGTFGTAPLLTIVFLVIGLLVGFIGAYRQLQTVLALIEERRQRRGDRTE